ncbi:MULTISPECIES: hypothetical protein [Bacillaceae]|uniref:hypothetical protein n=1 Tax=Bacillaceae TaxID=186817 RepID=UPI000BFE21CD|nr:MULTISPECIES: hypothetical protein [Bacillaceae]PGT88996.1 hypothetical protein COD11_04795 [Bacillus sp. AFS040349]UGB30619.1 hypothetical protein LPC09_23465 [Metabacillus sp. B2-18]
MKIHKSLLALAVFIPLLLFGCSNEPTTESKPNDKDVVASEKTLPENFHEIAFVRETGPMFEYMVKKSVNSSEFEQTWELYGFEKKLPSINFKEKDVFFIGVHESGSCPHKIENIEVSSDNKTMTLPLSEPEGNCTSDATPRTFVIQVDKETSEKIENVVIAESGYETKVPFE